ncbi:MAG: hypothetical protein LBC88_00390, partial [Spirochaetaceae bacterium]|nr:hypothetical protein [Spirochaetaceae bacterium]
GNHFERVNIAGALCNGAHYAAESYQKAADGEFFERWFAGCLLAAIPRGHTVIMGNAPFRRKKRLRKTGGGKSTAAFSASVFTGL